MLYHRRFVCCDTTFTVMRVPLFRKQMYVIYMYSENMTSRRFEKKRYGNYTNAIISETRNFRKYNSSMIIICDGLKTPLLWLRRENDFHCRDAVMNATVS